MAGYDIPTRAMRQQVASAIHLVVQASRLLGGRRKVVKVSEITGMEGEHIQMHDVFQFDQTGVDDEGRATGHFIATGIRPRCLERIEHYGIKLPPELFARRVMA
jgi:pilus assembly protein CpaF